VLPTLKKLVEELSCDTPSGMGMFGFVITSMASVVGPSVKFEKMIWFCWNLLLNFQWQWLFKIQYLWHPRFENYENIPIKSCSLNSFQKYKKCCHSSKIYNIEVTKTMVGFEWIDPHWIFEKYWPLINQIFFLKKKFKIPIFLQEVPALSKNIMD